MEIFIGMIDKIFLKEDGSLNMELINKLSLEESIDTMANFTDEQMEEYISKIPIKESREPYYGVRVNYTLEEEIERGTAVDAEVFLDNMRKKYKLV